MSSPLLIYNIFPRLAGKIPDWINHAKRAKKLGFNWIYLNPIQEVGFSGSLYSIKDYYRINPIFYDKGKNAFEIFSEFIREVKNLGLNVMGDLVINHTAVDSPLIKEHPEWFQWDPETGKIVNPCVREGDKIVTVWGDLAEIDNESSPDKESLWKYWKEMILFWQDKGISGWRCDAAYQIPVELWEFLISSVKEVFPDTIFFAETLGCTIEQIIKLTKANFDYNANSSKWWDYKEKWAIKQYQENSPLTSSVSFAESHDTHRLFSETGGNVNLVKQRYLFSAIFSTGVLMPIGFEFGFQKRLHVVETTPEDWEETSIDLTQFIQKTNELVIKYPVLSQDCDLKVLKHKQSDGVVLLQKTSINQKQRALLIINSLPNEKLIFCLTNLKSIFDQTNDCFEIGSEKSRLVSEGENLTLKAADLRIIIGTPAKPREK